MLKTFQPLHAFVAAIALIAAVCGITAAQTDRAGQSRFVISAKAGGVNAVTGRIGVHSKGSSVWEQLTIRDNLEGGDVVKTGLDGRVEILLNPGSYMRVGEDSEFELIDNSLDKLEVRLLRGTAIVEATGAEDTELQINITTPHAKMAIVQRGLYRVNVVPGDLTELIVRKGRVLLTDPETKVKGGKKLIFSGGGGYSIAKLTDTEKKDIDSFDVWSKDRAQMIAKANQNLTSRDRRLLRSGFSDLWAGRYGSYASRFGGFWLYDSFLNCHTFFPFYLGWGSPYGVNYSNAFYKSYWFKVRNSYYPMGGYDPFPSASASSPSTGFGSFGKGMPSSASTPINRGYTPKSGGSKMP